MKQCLILVLGLIFTIAAVILPAIPIRSSTITSRIGVRYLASKEAFQRSFVKYEQIVSNGLNGRDFNDCSNDLNHFLRDEVGALSGSNDGLVDANDLESRSLCWFG